jgi:prepilin-type N-terminal cleavage/methylation domain-containing protein
VSGRRRSDRGITLLEILITVALMSIAFASVLGGMGLFLKTEGVQRTTARLDVDLRTYTEQLLDVAYVNCATAASYSAIAAPAGYAASLKIAYWDGNLPAAFGSSCSTDKGVQQLTVVLTARDGGSATLVAGKAR